MILDVLGLINSSLDTVEKQFGKTMLIRERESGGETREYGFENYTVAFTFDTNHTVSGIVVEGFNDSKYRLNQWPLVLSQLGMNVLDQPDESAPAAAIWRNYQGYEIRVGLNKSYGVISMVRVAKTL